MLEGEIDFEGQKLVERISKCVLWSAGAVGFAAGLLLQDFRVTLAVVAAGLLVALAVCVPPWPIFRRHPLQWLAPLPKATPPSSSSPQPRSRKGKKQH